jgi:uridylate kinase
VHKARNGRYEAKRKKEGRFVYLGLFDTAVEAAVAHARAVAETDADEAAEASPADGAIPSASGGDGEPYRTIDGVAYIRALLDRATSLAKAGGTLAREIAR